MAAQLAVPAPALRKIDELGTTRRALTAELEHLERDSQATLAMGQITETDVTRLLSGAIDSMRDMHRETLKDILGSLAERIELHPETLECRIHYRIGIENRNEMASPRGFARGALRIIMYTASVCQHPPATQSCALDYQSPARYEEKTGVA